MMKLEEAKDLESFISENPQAKMLNFSPNKITKNSNINTIIIGCEGGFVTEEIELFDTKDIIGLDTPLVLKSESAVCGVGAKLLL